MATRNRPRKRNPRGKETTKRVASDAGRLLALCQSGEIWWQDHENRDGWTNIKALVKRVAASALVQKLPERKAKRKSGRRK